VPQDNPFSYDDNLVSNAINYGAIDEIDKLVPEQAFVWTVPVEKAPNQSQLIKLQFVNGLPVSLNGQKMKLADLMQKLNVIGGKHGVGRVDMIENGLYGNKFKWVYEAPAAQILIKAHKEIEKLVLPKTTLWFKHDLIDKQWAKLIYHAQVYSPLASALMAFIDDLQPYVNGAVTVKLFKGAATIIQRQCPSSLIGIEAKNLRLQHGSTDVPYGFEEYSFASKHHQVITKHLGKFKR